MASNVELSLFSIDGFLQAKEKENQKEVVVENTEKLPKNHFTETDLQAEWKQFLLKLKKTDIVAYNAINGFKISKKGEDNLEIIYSSESAKEEFDKCKDQFINPFKHKVQHYSLSIIFKQVEGAAKKEIISKRSKFEKLVQINPFFKDLNDLMQFDFS